MRKKRLKKEYSKKMATVILAVAIIDIQLTYILAFMGMGDTAETLSITLVTEVVAIYVAYCLKAFFGKKAEEETRLKEGDSNDERDNTDFSD